MQTLILTLIFSVGTFLCGNAQNSVEVVITNFDNEKGNALVGLYNTEDSFLEEAWQSKSAVIKEGQASVIFENIPDGTYAVSAFHDENDDQKLDMFLGFYPTEDYATSNNAPANFGLPKWETQNLTSGTARKLFRK